MFALIVMSPAELLPSAALSATPSALESVIAPAPLPVFVAPAMFSVLPVVVSAIGPPAVVTVNAVGFVLSKPVFSVMYAPADPVDAVTVSAFTRIGEPEAPMPAVEAPVLSATVPATPVSSSDAPVAASVIDPPEVLPPTLVFTVIVPPAPVVIPRSPAPPVPPPVAFTLIATAVAAVLPVAIVPPAPCEKPAVPVPAVFALIVIVPAPAFTGAFTVTAPPALRNMTLEVKPAEIAIPPFKITSPAPPPFALFTSFIFPDAVESEPPLAMVSVAAPVPRLVPPEPVSAAPAASVSEFAVLLATSVILPLPFVATELLTVMLLPACSVKFAFAVVVRLTALVTVMSFCA